MSIPIMKIKELTYMKKHDIIKSDINRHEKEEYMDYSIDIIISEKSVVIYK